MALVQPIATSKQTRRKGQTTPATISYTTGKKAKESNISDQEGSNPNEVDSLVENVIHFHAVISEGHKASTQITKFPIQDGFEISNHAIRKNRIFTLHGIFTNTLLANTNQIRYSENNSKEMFKVLESLVLSAKPCKVISNLGIYEPVIFTKFDAEQGNGSVDSLEFSMVGEEIQVAETISKSAPKRLNFIPVPKEEAIVLKDKFSQYGKDVDLNLSEISQASVLLGTDFTIPSFEISGKPFDTTLICTGQDLVTGGFTYDISTSLTDFVGEIELPSIPSLSDLIPTALELSGGLSGLTSCLIEGAADVGKLKSDRLINTVFGKLERNIYGGLKEVLNVGAATGLQSLNGMAADCFMTEVKSITKPLYETAKGYVSDSVKAVKKLTKANNKGEQFTQTEVIITKISPKEPRPLEVAGELKTQ